MGARMILKPNPKSRWCKHTQEKLFDDYEQKLAQGQGNSKRKESEKCQYGLCFMDALAACAHCGPQTGFCRKHCALHGSSSSKQGHKIFISKKPRENMLYTFCVECESTIKPDNNFGIPWKRITELAAPRVSGLFLSSRRSLNRALNAAVTQGNRSENSNEEPYFSLLKRNIALSLGKEPKSNSGLSPSSSRRKRGLPVNGDMSEEKASKMVKVDGPERLLKSALLASSLPNSRRSRNLPPNYRSPPERNTTSSSSSSSSSTGIVASRGEVRRDSENKMPPQRPFEEWYQEPFVCPPENDEEFPQDYVEVHYQYLMSFSPLDRKKLLSSMTAKGNNSSRLPRGMTHAELVGAINRLEEDKSFAGVYVFPEMEDMRFQLSFTGLRLRLFLNDVEDIVLKRMKVSDEKVAHYRDVADMYDIQVRLAIGGDTVEYNSGNDRSFLKGIKKKFTNLLDADRQSKMGQSRQLTSVWSEGGIRNTGDICYANAAVQLLSGVRSLDLHSFEDPARPVVTALSSLLRSIKNEKQRVHESLDLIQAVQKKLDGTNDLVNPERLREKSSDEFLLYLLDRAIGELDGCSSSSSASPASAKHGEKPGDQFKGVLKRYRECEKCKYSSEEVESLGPIFDFPLNDETVEESIRSLRKKDVMLEGECDKCGSRGTKVEHCYFETAPKTFLLLKSFNDYQKAPDTVIGIENVKNESTAQFGEDLEIEDKIKDTRWRSEWTPHNYRLRALIQHKGDGTDSGHYVTYAKRQDTWYCFDDARHKPVTVEEVLNAPGVTVLMYEQDE